MLKPTKYMDPNRSVLNTAFLLLKKIKSTKISKIDDLYDYAIEKLGEDIRELILPALGFLFSLGTIDYNEKRDSIILQVSQNEIN